jgi:hypothetical protein
VQEKDTITSVSAIKNIPAKLPTPALESVALVQEEGSVISKAPKKEMANMTMSTKKNRLARQSVESVFNAADPNIADTNTPRMVKMTMMDSE